MINKKLLKILTACILVIAVSIVGISTLISVKGASTVISVDFEDGLNGWGPRGSDIDLDLETVELSTEEAHGGTHSIKVSDRRKTWNGAVCDYTDTLTKGSTYTFSTWIKYTDNIGAENQNFSLQLQYNDGESDNYVTIKSSGVSKGNWTELTGTYTIPLDSKDVKLYVETQWKSYPSQQDLIDFYIDDFTAMPADLPEIQTNIASLKNVYSGKFLIGTAVNSADIAPKPGSDLVKKHFNAYTTGNSMKPDSMLDYDATIENGTETNPQVTLRKSRTALQFAKDNNIEFRGHTLVWHNQTPSWFFRVGYSKDANAAWASKDVMLKRMENYIKNVMAVVEKEFPDVHFYAWDVVNEAIDANQSDGWRRPGNPENDNGASLWMKTVGSEFVEKAFEYAKKYAPSDCKLYYNDYNEYESRKMNHIIALLKNLQSKNLVDGMGMQSHWTMDYPSVSMLETSIKNYDALGLEIQLTEIDVKNTNNDTSTLNRQKDRYKSMFSKVVELKNAGANINALIIWGLRDTTSWLGGYPLLFDDDYQAKPAFYGVVEAAGNLNTAPVTTAPVTTAPVTTAPVTTAPVTTAPVTTAPVTTAPVTTAPVTTAPVTTAPVTTNPSQGDLSVDYEAQNNWGTGATINVKVTNNSSSTVNDWTISWTFPGNQKITNMWCAKYSQSGSEVNVTNESWNGKLSPTGSTTFGFNINFSGLNDTPTDITIK